ncbi:MAG: LON peptidase substrate-binding domain-containing protein, partial [Pyrinomonadaceae bacterium]
MSENPEITGTPQESQDEQHRAEPFEIAVLPLQNTTLFPGTFVPLTIGRKRSVTAVEATLATEEKLIACLSVRPDKTGDAEAAAADLNDVGTLVMVKRMMRNEEGIQLIVQGTERVRVIHWVHEEPYLRARVRILPAPTVVSAEETEALQRNMQSLIQQALALLPQVPPEVRTAVLNATDPVQLAYFLGSVLDLGQEQEQGMLAADTVDELLRIAYGCLVRE